ncbi:MAG: hypothetical protein AAB778_03770 [Patescibacteria group bacterium]
MHTYHLIPDRSGQDLAVTLKKISDYLNTFVGDIKIESKNESEIEIAYSNTSFSATVKIDDNKIVLTTHEDDSITINLIKNIASNSGFRIFNTKHNYFLPNDPKLMDISSIGIDKKIYEIFKKENLTPLFQYRDSYIYFCLNKKKEVVLINRHYLEHLLFTNHESLITKELFVKIAPDISVFIALFDRGLISLVFPKYQNSDTKVTNLSGFDIFNLPKDTKLNVINFKFNNDNQAFDQQDTTDIIPKKYLALKIGQDYTYSSENGKLIKILKCSLFTVDSSLS